MAITPPPYAPKGTTFHDAVHETLRQNVISLSADVETLKAGGTSHTHVAADITSGTFSLALMPAGSTITVDKVKNGGSWPSRPTARTDVRCDWLGNTDPGGAAINGDTWGQEP